MSMTTRYGHSPRKEMLAFIPKMAARVLDVGCHTGGFGAALKELREMEVWGIEPNEQAISQATPLLDKAIAAPFSESAPIPENYFDVIVFNDVLEHLIDPWSALRLAGRKLRSGGLAVASIPNLRHIECFLHIFAEGDFRYEAQGIRDRTHLRFFTRKSATRLFEESGYEVLRVEGINVSWWTPSIGRRLAFRIWRKRLEDMKYLQYAFVARPIAS